MEPKHSRENKISGTGSAGKIAMEKGKGKESFKKSGETEKFALERERTNSEDKKSGSANKTSNTGNSVSKSVINLSALDYEKIAELQNKFDKFNQPKSLKVDREQSVAHILSNMEQEKIEELKAKFENLNVKRFVHMDDNKDKEKFEDDNKKKPKRKSMKMEEFRKVRESIEQQILEREILIMDKKRETTKKVHLKQLYGDAEKAKIAINLINATLKEEQEEVVNDSNILTSIENQYKKIPKNSSVFLIWRVETTKLEPLSKDQYGTFYDKECYVIYAATPFGQPSGSNSVSREIRGKIEHHLHFWLGLLSPSESAGVAAYSIVELDGLIGGTTTQHREIQGKESPRFKSYFKEGMSVLYGTAEQFYKSLEEDPTPRLFRVRGFQVPVLNQMADVSWQHFTSSDVFLLYTTYIIFVWVGRSAPPIQKLHATEAAIQIGKSYDITQIIFVDDGYEKTLPKEDRIEFEKFLPGNLRSVKAVDQVIDLTSAARFRTNLKLYHCSNSSGKYRVTEMKTGPLKQDDLISNNVFILDHGINGIWVWVGKNADNKEKVEAIRNARGFVKKKKYPNYTPVTRIVDGEEPAEFKSLFSSWKEKEEQKSTYGRHRIAVTKVTKFDVLTMHDRPELSARSQLFDDGSGNIRMWRIHRLDTFEIPKERLGVFFTADSYIILYNYKSPSAGTRWVTYYWMGFHSELDEQGVAELKATELNSAFTADRGAIARIYQGKEPAHFLQLFKGRMRVFSGRGSDFDVSSKNLKTPTHYLLQIQGSASYNTRATQVKLKASSLNSNYCFVLRKGTMYYVWCGSHSTGDNREMAKGFAGPDFVLLLEGSETSEFWLSVCGKQEYKSPKYIEFNERSVRPRLFHCLIINGVVTAAETLNFVQKDLYPEQIMLLDAQHSIYLWIGDECTNYEERMCIEIANEYLRTDPCGRDTTIPIIQLRQGYEPPTFTGFFETWDSKLWRLHKTYEDLRTKIEIESSNSETLAELRTSIDTESAFDKFNKYAVAVLRGPIENLPASVDPLKKELHLTYDDFVSIFRMEYKDFEKYPLWKQQEMKKHVGLF